VCVSLRAARLTAGHSIEVRLNNNFNLENALLVSRHTLSEQTFLDTSLVQSLMVAGIAGAGLVLAVYSIVLTRVHPFLHQRAQVWWQSLLRLRRRTEQIEAQTSTEAMEGLEREFRNVRTLHDLPVHLTWGLILPFFGYCALSLLAGAWFTGWNKAIIDKQLLNIFLITTAVFLISGFFAIKDLIATIDNDYRAMRQTATENQQSNTQQ